MRNSIYSIYIIFFLLFFSAVRCLSNSALPYHSFLFLFHGGVETWQGITTRPGCSGNPHSPPLHRLLLSLVPAQRMVFGWDPLILTHGTCWGPGEGQQFGAERNCSSLGGWMGMSILSFILHKNSNTEWEPSQNNHKDRDVSCNIYSAVVHFPQAKFPPNALSFSSLPSAPLALQSGGFGPLTGTPGDPPVSESRRCVLGGEAVKLYADRETFKICWK